MISALKALFSPEAKEASPEQKQQQLQQACAGLFFEVIRADFNQSPEEIDKVKDILAAQFSLSEQSLSELVEDSRSTAKENIALHPLTSLINDNYDYDERVKLISLMWSIAYADGDLDKYEDGVIRKVADLLYVRHSDFIKTKLANSGEHESADMNELAK